MLILTRRVGETLMIGSNVAVTVVGVKGGQVRIGTDAPKSTPVHQEGLYDRIRCAQRKPQRPCERPNSTASRRQAVEA